MSFSKTVTKEFRKLFSLCSSSTVVFGLIILLVLILGYVFPVSYILTIPFIVLPFLFSYQVSLIQAKYIKKSNIRNLFIGFKLYFSPKGYGCFSALKGLLKAFVAFIICFSIAMSISLTISMGVDKSLSDLLNKIISSTSLQDYMNYLDALANNDSFIFCSNLSLVISFLPCLYMFFHNTFVYSIKTYMSLNNVTNQIPMKGLNIIYKTAFPYIRKKFYKDYYSVIWFNIILFIIGYVLGVIIGMLFLYDAYGFRIATLGLSVAFLFNLMFLPLIFILLENLFLRYKQEIFSASLIKVVKESEKCLKDASLSPSEKEHIEQIREEYQKILDEIQKKDDKKE